MRTRLADASWAQVPFQAGYLLQMYVQGTLPAAQLPDGPARKHQEQQRRVTQP